MSSEPHDSTYPLHPHHPIPLYTPPSGWHAAMSEYSYDDRPRRGGSRRTRDREPEYASETTYIERGGKGAPVRDLVYRPREDSIEDIPRDFPPPGGEYRQSRYRETDYAPRARSAGRRSYDDRSDYGYPPSSRGGGRRRSSYDRDGYYSDDYDKPRRERRKSVVDNIKDTAEGLGLGGVIAAVTGKKSRSRSRSRHGGWDDDSDRYDRRSRRYSDESTERSRSRGGKGHKSSAKWEQAAKAAVVAGAIEAFRSRKEPGPWTGQKGQRVATAALGAAGIDSLVDKDPSHKGKRHVAEAALGGLVANRLANGSRSQSRGRGRDASRSRSRSRSTGGGLRARSRSLFGRGRSQSRGRDGEDKSHTLRDVAGAGAVLAAGKALYDRVRSKSRSAKDRNRSRSVSSEDSYVPSRGRNHNGGRSRDMESYDGASRNSGSQSRAVAKKVKGGNSSEDSESTTDMERKRKKMRGKELLTAGFATVATIHAAHGVYSSMVASEKRRKLVSEGEITPEEARKRKSKNMLQDAAAVGIAALGIKSAFSEWKEMNEQRHTVKELEDKRRKRRKQREKMEKEARQNALGGGGGGGGGGPVAIPNGQYANAYPAYPTAPRQQAYPTTYADANPYGSVPPPPIGAPPGARY
ncbi:uncharacterized protein BDZ99DRAFT_517719 [Mytilinidion resinicola]|uniref:DUF3824 domain-containing protein n=1 Tax=Mytilinidion resinicola TaxID=574789 RepID=A0A6A6YX01_9PEZI|nr:uncharacterized protein BDZ99DRAFT_517719 [Mytilinidion resinicola]KAF2813462.1 hypothetical protein BDZ99DRAFT_517719 [Mytilinidion resinicola]